MLKKSILLLLVITMFAAMTFDPRLIWDTESNTHE